MAANKEFCIKCGGKVEYSLNKPRFCPSCGSPFNTSLGAFAIASSDDDDDEPASTSYDLEKLRKSVAAQFEGSKMKLDEIWSDPQPRSQSHREPSNDPDGLSILNKTLQDCKASKDFKDVGE